MIFIPYIFITLILSLVVGLRKNTLMNNKYINNFLILVLFFLISIGIFTLDINDFIDLNNYYVVFQRFKNSSFLSLAQSPFEPMFSLIMWLSAKLSFSFNFFLVIVWNIIFINFYQAFKIMFNDSERVFVLLGYLNFFIFFDYVLNVIRQGLAISFLILALSILITVPNQRKKTFFVCLFLAPLFHNSAIFGSLVLLLLRFFKLKLKTILIIWFFFIILFVTGLNRIFSILPISDISFYTSESVLDSYSQTNRIDFLIFTVFFALVGIYLYYKFNRSMGYNLLLKYYLLMNILFFALGFIGYSDRLAAYSWFVIIILLWKGIETAKHYRIASFLILNSFILLGIIMGAYYNILLIFQIG